MSLFCCWVSHAIGWAHLPTQKRNLPTRMTTHHKTTKRGHASISAYCLKILFIFSLLLNSVVRNSTRHTCIIWRKIELGDRRVVGATFVTARDGAFQCLRDENVTVCLKTGSRFFDRAVIINGDLPVSRFFFCHPSSSNSISSRLFWPLPVLTTWIR